MTVVAERATSAVSDRQLRLVVISVSEIPEARTRVRSWAEQLGFADADKDRLDDLAVVCSELVTNALLHTTGPALMRVQLRRDGAISLLVADSSKQLPSTGTVDGSSIGGRGMTICMALSSSLSMYAGRCGKALRALVRPTPPSS